MSTNQLKAQREPLVTALREIRDAATAAGTLTDEQTAKATELRGKLADLDRRIDLDGLIEEQERRMQGVALTTAAGGDQFEQLAGQVTLVDVMRAQMGETDAAAGRAREVSKELERRSGRRAQGFDMRLSGAKPEQRGYTTTNPGACGRRSRSMCRRSSPRKEAAAQWRGRRLRSVRSIAPLSTTGQRNLARRAMRNVTAP
jgi:hypothetical protein